MLIYYGFSSKIIRNVNYGEGSLKRNLLDIYLPSSDISNNSSTRKTPVVIFVTGGAWIIGYKLWSALVGRGLSKLG